LKSKIGITEDNLVIIAGSTHPEEEELILDTYRQALTDNELAFNNNQMTSQKNLKLIIAPRHPERFDAVAKVIENAGYNVCRFSKNEKLLGPNDVYLLDTIGQLANFYALATLAFVGGTIANVGGHNLLEPYLYAVPVVCGPHLFKTRETATILSKEKALYIANDAQEVKNKMIELLQNENLRKQMGAIGQRWLENNRGAVAKSIDAIAALFDEDKLKPDKSLTSNNSPTRKTEIMTK